jgi:hypothetical protein
MEMKSKGGILFPHIAYVKELIGWHIPVSKKQLHGKFKDSVTVELKSKDEGESKIISIVVQGKRLSLFVLAVK